MGPGSYIRANHQALIEEIKGSANILQTNICFSDFFYDPRNDCITGTLSLMDNSFQARYFGRIIRNKQDLQDQINLDLAQIFYNHNYGMRPSPNFRFNIVSAKLDNFTVVTQSPTPVVMPKVEPRCQELSQRVYDFSTGFLNLPLIEHNILANLKEWNMITPAQIQDLQPTQPLQMPYLYLGSLSSWLSC